MSASSFGSIRSYSVPPPPTSKMFYMWTDTRRVRHDHVELARDIPFVVSHFVDWLHLKNFDEERISSFNELVDL